MKKVDRRRFAFASGDSAQILLSVWQNEGFRILAAGFEVVNVYGFPEQRFVVHLGR